MTDYSDMVSRLIPPQYQEAIDKGIMKIWGGAIRMAKGQENAGAIVKHLQYPYGFESVELSKIISPTSPLFQQLAQVQQSILISGGLNLIGTLVSTAYLSKKINELSKKLDKISGKLDEIKKELKLYNDVALSQIFADAKTFAGRPQYYIKSNSDVLEIRRVQDETLKAFNRLVGLFNEILTLSDEDILKRFEVLILLGEWMNHVSFTIMHAYSHLEELDHAHSVAQEIVDLNKQLHDKLVDLLVVNKEENLGALSEDEFQTIKSQTHLFLGLESTAQRIENELDYCLENNINYLEYQQSREVITELVSPETQNV